MQMDNKAEHSISDRERLSEETLSISLVAKRCDSPNPDKVLEAVVLWKKDLSMNQISREVGIPERTIRRYLNNLGFKRDYSYVSRALTGKPKSDTHKLNLSISRKNKGIAKKEKNPNWRGGISPIWNTSEWKIWRSEVFKRDDYTCKGCGLRNKMGLNKSLYLEAHHILPRRDFPLLTFDISNGITLCKCCHDKTRKKEYLSVNIWKQRV